MPRKPMKPCKHPGCPKLTDGMYCTDHAKLHTADRASASVRGYDGRWEKARKRFLKAHPLCVKCMEQGRLTRATVVDHIIPHRGDAELFWDEKYADVIINRYCQDFGSAENVFVERDGVKIPYSELTGEVKGNE